jgi:gelsolin
VKSDILKPHFHQQLAHKIKAAQSNPSVHHVGSWHPGPEHAWDNAGQESGLQIWRVQNFELVAWPPKEYGKFYNGDSYIVLKTIVKEDVKYWDIHFWLGELTSTDEAGTAAYKTVELDEKLGGKARQHREVQGYESELFLSYFKPSIHILSGGVESGFHHVTPEEYKPRLLHIKGKRTVRSEEVPLASSSLNSGDVFILDNGLQIYVWQGRHCNSPEKFRAGEIAHALRDERDCHPVVTILEEGSHDDPAAMAKFWQLLGGEGPVAPPKDDDAESAMKGNKCLLHFSDEGGSVHFNVVATDRVPRSHLNSNDVYIFDTGSHIFVWIGRHASHGERSHSLDWAQQYLIQHNRPPYLPITKIFDGGENELFEASFD